MAVCGKALKTPPSDGVEPYVHSPLGLPLLVEKSATMLDAAARAGAPAETSAVTTTATAKARRVWLGMSDWAAIFMPRPLGPEAQPAWQALTRKWVDAAPILGVMRCG